MAIALSYHEPSTSCLKRSAHKCHAFRGFRLILLIFRSPLFVYVAESAY